MRGTCMPGVLMNTACSRSANLPFILTFFPFAFYTDEGMPFLTESKRFCDWYSVIILLDVKSSFKSV